MVAYRNRSEGGAALAERLRTYAGGDTVVFGIPRGGVVTAREVADALDAPLELAIVRKIGSPGDEELALGAVTDKGETLFDERFARTVDPEWLARETDRQIAEAKRRRRFYTGDQTPLSVGGKTVVLVDDGLATGLTAIAAVLALRKLVPRRIIVAAPVASREAVERLRAVADEVVVDRCPTDLVSVGQWYEEFPPVEDQEVLALMRSPSAGVPL